MSINKILLLSCMFFTAVSAAAACQGARWEVEGKAETICYDEKTDVRMSASCQEKSCEARALVEKARTLDLKNTESRPKNPGTAYCNFLNGKVVMGENSRGSQTAFCKASDGTLVDLSGMAQHASE